jgi:hypothetical protein
MTNLTESFGVCPSENNPLGGLKYLQKPILVSAALYLVPKVLQTLCQRPVAIRPGTLDQFFASCSDLRDAAERTLGEKRWAFLNNVVLDNAWISSFVVSILLGANPPPLDAKTYGYLGLEALGICALSWFTRYAIAHHLPSIAERIAAAVAPAGHH